MKKENKARANGDMLREYDFSRGVRGKYAKQYARGSNIIVLSPDLARVFPDSQSVERALRTLVQIARRATKRSA